ncbi:hypothetical protein C8A05DRAFT_43319 [Staphylotrichum tortipilum]|uniref:P-type phospholipid transporter n=1 Tax=Staphylotrichum tortipilum TaxID=2831512 RepID=A0AAN6MNE5_9PEZI|nr:hypothetical protein C8A05DRAFT_43319 [Staphylotrichum longicolle]
MATLGADLAADLGEGAGQELSTQRSRWATRKLTVKSSSLKRLSLKGRRQNKAAPSEEKKRASGGTDDSKPDDGVQHDNNGDEDETGDGPGPRQLYFNIPLPRELRDDEGHPIQQYTRNKIRTAKYTPLSFIPKNLFFQFQNIANIFFLFLVILVIFPIFGGVNPGLNAVPLIFIVCVTAIKDAIEDYRRTILDNELNNAPVHRLVGKENVNVLEDNVSGWRKFKKANSRFFGSMWHAIEGLWKKDAQPAHQNFGSADPRMSIETRVTPWDPSASPNTRQSIIAAPEEIQMTPVPSPLPRDPDMPSISSAMDSEAVLLQNLKGDVLNEQVPISGKARFHRDAWKNLVVGDFVRIYNDDELPADIIILATSDPDGACYVETKNLDGETNLKVRSALRCGRTLKHARDCERAQFVIESEAPQPNLYKYNAAIKWAQSVPWDPKAEPHEMSEPISIDNMLLRGCNLRNTEWALGVVVFTGHDTKIMMNAGITPSKRARIARELNFNVICNFGILLIMCLVTAIANGVAWGKTDASLAWFEYGSIGGTPGLTGFITFWAAVIVFQNLIPISLYISLEIVRTLQAFFIYSDIGMYYDKIDQPCIPKSWNISDDVGQIEYIFSDKTGTLTQNVMEFKKATINGQPYGEAYTEAQAGMNKRMGIDVEQESKTIQAEIAEAKVRALRGLRQLHNNPYLHDEDLTFIAPDFVEDLAGNNGPEQQQANEHFMLALALCHTVIAEKQPGNPPKMIFKAQSPDEAALVATARDMGFTVLGSANEGINVNVMGTDQHFAILTTIEFNSSRKRMSAIVRMPDGRILLLCKGADSVIYSRLKKGEQVELRRETAKHLEMFAVEGLRTLCIAEKELTEDEYREWRKEHDVAATALENREEKLEEVADRIERDLTLLGGTAIEDRLQDGVPDTIALLGDAGIKLWVLTGDKVETAINIGFSCNLLNNDMDLIRLQVHEDEAGLVTEEEYLSIAEEQLDNGLAKFNMTGSDEELKHAMKDHEAPAATHALVIDGFTLRWALSDALKQKFLLLCKQCKSVLCCRVSPAQKAAVVSMVKNGLDVMTLSIGDGANDVAMIQEADVGVGIAGVEGRQAFRFLQRLVLSISNFFYKNMIFCNFDVSYIFEYTYILLFNLVFTSVPVILMGVLDQDVSDTVSLERKEWTQNKFWAYMIDGIYQSVMSFFIPFIFVMFTTTAASNGLDVSERTRLGCYIAHPAIFTINAYILINTNRWDWLMLLVVIISDIFIFFWTGIYTSFTSAAGFYEAAPQIYQQLTFWMCLIVTPIICLLPRIVVKCIQKQRFPYDVDIIRERAKMGVYADADAAAAAATGVTEGVEGASAKSSTSSKLSSRVRKPKHMQYASVDEDRRPIYPPSIATHNTRTQNGSDGTTYIMQSRASAELQRQQQQQLQDEIGEIGEEPERAATRPSIDRCRPSYDRVRRSMDRVRPSFEASNDFTSAARLSRIESSHSAQGHPHNSQRRFNLNTVPGSTALQCYAPATGQFLGLVNPSTTNAIDRAVEQAHAAQAKWASTSFRERRAVLRSLLQYVLDNQEEICRVACLDSGKTMVDAQLGEVLVTVEKLKWTIEHGEKALRPSRRPTNLLLAYKRNTVYYEPLGVVAALVSWNYPFHNLIGPVISALFSGNGILVKVSEQTAWSSSYFTNIIRGALVAHGHDPALVQTVVCWPQTANHITSHPGISHITFIGSRPICHKVATSAASALIPVVAELGGKDASIVLDSVSKRDLPRVIEILMRGSFQASGQNCIGIERIVAAPAIYDRLVSILEPRVRALRLGPTADVGAMISDASFARLEALIADAVRHGARLLAGGTRFAHPEHPKGHYFSPTLLVDVTPDMAIAKEECFAPVMVLMRAPGPSAESILSVANAPDFGLGSSVFGAESDPRVRAIVRGIKAGMIAVNDFGATYAVQMPFGGVAGSGYGRFAGEEGLRGLCNVKAVCEDRAGWLGIRTGIPPPMRYPVMDQERGWRFAKGVVEVGYGMGMARKVGGVLGIMKNS